MFLFGLLCFCLNFLVSFLRLLFLLLVFVVMLRAAGGRLPLLAALLAFALVFFGLGVLAGVWG